MTGTELSNASVIIVNFNGAPFLEELLGSLRLQTVSGFETILVDNASTDESLKLVARHAPSVRVLPQSTNLGFARAGNIGVRAATGEFVALLNPDLRLEPNWLAVMLQCAAPDAEVGAVASKMRLYDRPHLLNGVGGEMNYLGYTWDRGMLQEDLGQFDEPAEVIFASAGAALFRRDAFLDAGGFDERFFMYHEDVDLCWRLWLLGFRVVTAPGAVAYHHFGAVTRSSRGMQWRELLGERNNMRTLIKNYEMRNLANALAGMLALRQPLQRKAGQLRNLCWNLWNLPGTLELRRNIQARRVRSDKELRHLIAQSPHVPVRL